MEGNNISTNADMISPLSHETQKTIVTNNAGTKMLGENASIVIGVIGIFIPIGIQDFATKRYGWATFHILSKFLGVLGFMLWLFDGYCAGGYFCSRAPGIIAFIGSIGVSAAVISFIFGIIECAQLMSKRKITIKFRMALVFILVLTIPIFLYRLATFYNHS